MPLSCSSISRIPVDWDCRAPPWAVVTVRLHPCLNPPIGGPRRRTYWPPDPRRMIRNFLWRYTISKPAERINWVWRKASRCAYLATTNRGSGARRTRTPETLDGCPPTMSRRSIRWRSTPGTTGLSHATPPSIFSAPESMAVSWSVKVKVHRVKGASVWGA